jgi:hypothetical protein
LLEVGETGSGDVGGGLGTRSGVRDSQPIVTGIEKTDATGERGNDSETIRCNDAGSTGTGRGGVILNNMANRERAVTVQSSSLSANPNSPSTAYCGLSASNSSSQLSRSCGSGLIRTGVRWRGRRGLSRVCDAILRESRLVTVYHCASSDN